MPAVILKSTSATNGIVCLSQACRVGDDGLVAVNARFLLRSTADLSQFAFDSLWPSGSSPRGLPGNQGGPYLANRDFEYSNGLIFCNAVYVTATNPVRVVYGENKATRAFSGTTVIIDDDGVATPVSGSFDYITTVASARYSIVGSNSFAPNLAGRAKIVALIGQLPPGVEFLTKSIESTDTSELGLVKTITKTLEIVYYS